MREFEVNIGKTNYIGNAEITATPKKRIAVYGSTARHEAKHVVAALHNGTKVNKVTIVPGPGYNGLTELSKADPVAALAPHATGEDGTSWDVFIASRMSGSSGAESAARSIIHSNSDEVKVVAQALEEQKTLTGSDVNQAIRNKNKQEVAIVIKAEGGNIKVMPSIEADNGIVMVPGEWIELGKSSIVNN